MYKVLIVDDEAPGRKLLKYLIDWEYTNFEIVATAENGQEGYEKYLELRPDLIITDIQMPVLDGLDMISKIRREDKEQKFVILSCYEDFSYAQRAIKMNVTDYLIKDLVTKESVFELLLRISKELSSNKEENMSQEGSSPTITDPVASVFSDILAMHTIMQIKDVENTLTKEQFNLEDTSSMAVISIHVDGYEISLKNNEVNLNFEDLAYFAYEISQILDNENGGKCFSLNNNGEIFILAGLKNTASKVGIMENCNSLLEKIRTAYYKINENTTITIGISNFFNDMSFINKYIDQAKHAMKLKLFLGNNRNIYYSLFPSNFMEANPQILENRFENFESHLLAKNKEKVLLELNGIFNEGIKGFMQYNYLNYVNSRLLDIAIYEINKNEIPYKDVFKKDFIPIDYLNHLETVDEICIWFKEVYSNILEFMQNDSKILYSKHIHDTFEIIKKNYSENDIGLTMIADKLSLHKVYLCRIFKEETGQNIKDVIHSIRIDKAKELIKAGDYKLYEISDMVGYATPQQLNLYFKKITGLSPNKYRASI